MHYACYFDGDELTDATAKNDTALARADMLYQMLVMDDNEGEVSEFLSRCLPHYPS